MVLSFSKISKSKIRLNIRKNGPKELPNSSNNINYTKNKTIKTNCHIIKKCFSQKEAVIENMIV